MSGRVLVAMSGGVDSSVAAYLLTQAGYECIGATMHLFDNETAGLPATRTCCSLADVEDARRVAWRLGIPHYVLNFKEAFARRVIDRFARVYASGGTPNPCIDCNRFLKFDLLLQKARELECDCIATGHYARIARTRSGWALQKAADGGKDQSYVLYFLSQVQLAHLKLPLGGLKKEQVRQLAAQNGFCNAEKPDSQDLCFVPDGDYAAFLERYTGRVAVPGNFIDEQGHILGRHAGLTRYTVGQRRGLGVAAGEPLYVCEKNIRDNTIRLGSHAALLTGSFEAEKCCFSAGETPAAPFHAGVRTRYHQKEQPAWVTQLPGGRLRVDYDEPQPAPAPGQAAVFYDGQMVLGGATVCGK